MQVSHNGITSNSVMKKKDLQQLKYYQRYITSLGNEGSTLHRQATEVAYAYNSATSLGKSSNLLSEQQSG